MPTEIEHCVRVSVRHWAGARAAAGVEIEDYEAATVAELIDQMTTRHAALGPVLQVASLLVDGSAATPDTDLTDGQLVEVLPPFAGG
ncbi:MAG TPA: MoaD/ThiS family protein [Phycicoccus sp.]|jgi:molybdopterin synthase sulfur carrier subunit|nr:MoaD/ThiS family protein [Phycicoccus sp.]HQK31122.1 MoaD/ThiS family protein [Phycicoccus sp.]HRA46319.1 MoaD/ThiS family protein [Phycicoccus sp.]